MSMKTTSILFATLLVGSVVMSSFAATPEANPGLAVIPVKGSQVFKVVYKGETESKVKLNLYDAQARLVFSKIISSDGFILPLNFSGLQFGEYKLELIDGRTRKEEKIVFTHEKAVANAVHISRIEGKDRFLLSVMSTKTPNEQVSVRIYAAGDLIHSETKKLAGDFAQVYAVKDGKNVTFEVIDNNGNITKTQF